MKVSIVSVSRRAGPPQEGHVVYNSSIHRLGPGHTAIFTNMTPFFALIGSFFFLGESIYASQIAGFLLISAGVFLGSGAARGCSSSRCRRAKSPRTASTSTSVRLPGCGERSGWRRWRPSATGSSGWERRGCVAANPLPR